MDGALYDYEIQYNASQVLYERLVKTNKSLKEELFVRQWDGTEYSYETFQTASQELTKYTRNNTAFLSVLHVFNDPDALKIFDWFLHKILFLDEANRLSNHPLIRKLEEEPFKKEVIKLLKIADLSIQDVTARRVERREKNTIGYEFDSSEVIQEVDIDLHYLSFDEAGAPIGTETINWTMDSKGTVRMLHLACVMVDAYNKGKTIFIDEFDTAFHVSICEFLMAIMNSKRNSSNQFVVTSHEIELLDQPLRSDQIWFVNKSFKNESELYSLFDFADLQKKRGDLSYAKRYMKGEFGATPVINEYLSEQYLEEAEVSEQ
ncbi:AAA family ATPase [Lysinibacillus boronitolerans]|uniref:AAA family ATPase n=1 Tax=Lysinibacillus boronitolerans TaxID=309788 RepID=UPI0002FA2954|nr:AAA family ATPase [Lysinibacillus boronitolerans]